LVAFNYYVHFRLRAWPNRSSRSGRSPAPSYGYGHWFKRRHLTGSMLAPIFIPGPYSHRALGSIKITIKATGLTHELTAIDPLGANRSRSRLQQAHWLALWFQSQYTGPIIATFKFNSNSLPLQFSSFACGALAPRGGWLRQKSCQEISCSL
jgi:hypothetical protein